MVHVESAGAGAAVDGGVENSIEGTSGARALEGELVLAAGEDAHPAGVASVPRGADTPSVRDDLVVAAGVAVALAVQQLIVLALTYAERPLPGLARRTGAGVSVVNQIARTNSTDVIDDESVAEGSTGGADLRRVKSKPLLANAPAIDQNLVRSASRTRAAVGSGR